MMVGLHGALTREQGFGSLVRQRSGWVLSAALLAMLVSATIAAAPAAADTTVTINHLRARQCGGPVDGGASYCVGSKPIIKVTSSLDGTGPTFEGTTVDNVEPRGGPDAISKVTATIDPAPSSPFTADPVINGQPQYEAVFCEPPADDPLKNAGPARASSAITIGCEIPEEQPRGGESFYLGYYPGVAPQSLDVEFNDGRFTPCSAPYGPGPGAARDVARAADACTPPSQTRITQAKIKGNTASFRFTARGAASFQCTLVRNRKVMFNRACRSPKPYANPLPHGKYTFIVTGINRGGLDRKPAIKKFTVK